MAKKLWDPNKSSWNSSLLSTFINQVSEQHRLNLTSPRDLYEWSISDLENFWSSVWDFGQIIGFKGKSAYTPGEKIYKAKFFKEALINFAENIVRRKDDQTAIIFTAEGQFDRSFSHWEMYQQVAKYVKVLKDAGLKKGDRVAAYLPNTPETLFVALATSAIGGVFSTCSPDFGVNGVLDRFSQIAPKIFIGIDQYFYRGKWFDCRDRLTEIKNNLPSLKASYLMGFTPRSSKEELEGFPNLQNVIEKTPFEEIEFERVPFDHPLYIMFSSGTTGVPKCIVHSVGGTLIQHIKEHQLHCDLKPDDRILYFTTTGWMMWQWLISALASKATIILYEGSPIHPTKDILFDLIDKYQITHFGTSAKFIEGIKKMGICPKKSHKLNTLKTILSTGSPLSDAGFNYVYEDIKKDVILASISGGTDIVSCFVLGNPLLPVYEGQIQCRGLGMAVDVLDENGISIIGEKGELVCKKPFPSMPVCFWNDPDGHKYQQTYFNKFPNTWCHGDFAERTKEDGIIIHGRSDTVLNPGGVRIGTAEIYRQVEKIEEVTEGIVVGQNYKNDVRVILFVTLKEGETLTPELIEKIKETIRLNTTPRHVPAKILDVPEIPRTKSGKIVELAVKNAIHGIATKNKEALLNPKAIKFFESLVID